MTLDDNVLGKEVSNYKQTMAAAVAGK